MMGIAKCVCTMLSRSASSPSQKTLCERMKCIGGSLLAKKW